MEIIKGKVAYYSHPMDMYNTKKEKKILKKLNQIFEGQVICPNNHIGSLTNIRDYLTISANADVIFVSPSIKHKKYVSKGCYKEIKNALSKKILVISVLLDKKFLQLRNVIGVQEENINDFKKYACIETFDLFILKNKKYWRHKNCNKL